MKHLIAVNSNLSQRTALFWIRHRKKIEGYLNNYEVWLPTSTFFKVPIDINQFDSIVLIGDDTFFSCFINSVFYELVPGERQTCIAFIPDSKSTAVTKGLGIPARLSKQCELILKRQSVLMDLVRCHYVDKKGIPRSRFLVNDAIIGMSPIKLPFFLKTIAEIVKTASILPIRKTNKQIKLYTGGNIIYDGSYTFSAILLGRKLINGPKLPGKEKLRCNLSYFDYYQLNTKWNRVLENQRLDFIRTNHKRGNKYLFSGSFDELTIKGDGQENPIIADGIYLGRLPATFSFLPKCIRVIAPLLTVRVCQPWQQKVSAAGIPKPIGSRNSLYNSSSSLQQDRFRDVR